MRITHTHDHTRWICWIFYQLLPTISVGNEWGQQTRIQLLILGFKGLKNVAVVMTMWLGRVSLCPGATNRDIHAATNIFSFPSFCTLYSLFTLPIRLNLSSPAALLASKFNISIYLTSHKLQRTVFFAQKFLSVVGITPIIKITYRFNINFSQPEQRYRFKKRKLKSNLVRRVLSPWNEVGLT